MTALSIFLFGVLFGYGMKCGAVARKQIRDDIADIKASLEKSK